MVQAQSYETIKTITGSSDQTTDYFYVPTGEWRISWSYVPNPSYAHFAGFSVFAYPKGETAAYTASVTEMGDNVTSGVTYVHERQGGEYYLKVGAANLKSYTIIIEKLTNASPSPSIPEFSEPILIVLLAALSIAAIFVSKSKVSTKKQVYY